MNTSDIYEPHEDSFLLQQFVHRYASGKVLDMGTGSGIQALTAAKSRKVKSVLAVDINPEAIEQLKEKIKNILNNQNKNKKRYKKITFQQGDLFSNVSGKFDTIIFNPPYLPQDRGIEDSALYGGKKGWEISARFFKEASSFLQPQGKILFLFSSHTNKVKIEEIISHQLLEYQELGRLRLPFFEELYVYLVEKSKVLQEVEQKGVTAINFLARGKRGIVFRGDWKNNGQKKKIALKVENPRSNAPGRIAHEASGLKKMNISGIGPKYYFSGKRYVAMKLVEGKFIEKWIKESSAQEIRHLLRKVLKQCFKLDTIKMQKEEMHHPYKHVLITSRNNPMLLDFERLHFSQRPSNVTQFIEYICRMHNVLAERKVILNVEKLRELAGEYKRDVKKAKSLLIVNKRFHISNAFDIRKCSCIEYTLFTTKKMGKIYAEIGNSRG